MPFEDKKQTYINSALNPSVYPGSDCEQCQSSSTLGGIFEVGSDICLKVPEPVSAYSLFNWTKVDGNLEERGLNTHCRSLWIPNAQMKIPVFIFASMITDKKKKQSRLMNSM